MVKLKVKNKDAAEAWCTKYVGPHRYYLHNRAGGAGWSIMRSPSPPGFELWLEDDKKATMAMLMLIE